MKILLQLCKQQPIRQVNELIEIAIQSISQTNTQTEVESINISNKQSNWSSAHQYLKQTIKLEFTPPNPSISDHNLLLQRQLCSDSAILKTALLPTIHSAASRHSAHSGGARTMSGRGLSLSRCQPDGLTTFSAICRHPQPPSAPLLSDLLWLIES